MGEIPEYQRPGAVARFAVERAMAELVEGAEGRAGSSRLRRTGVRATRGGCRGRCPRCGPRYWCATWPRARLRTRSAVRARGYVVGGAGRADGPGRCGGGVPGRGRPG